MSDISLDFGVLGDSRRQVDSVISTLQRAGAVGADLAGLVGYPSLASKVESFADGWDINRGKLVDELTAISETLQAIIDSFSDLDRQMATTPEATE